MSEREEWMNLIRNEYDPAPRHYRPGDDWDDGAGRIADAIIADKTLLQIKHAAEIERLSAIIKKATEAGAYCPECDNTKECPSCHGDDANCPHCDDGKCPQCAEPSPAVKRAVAYFHQKSDEYDRG
jgi:hypothetical protein